MTTEQLAKLTPEQKRIRIAELCGHDWRGIESAEDRIVAFGNVLPDYLSDLNAMHEAEQMLDSGVQIIGYLQHLGVTKGTHGVIWAATHATAAQRADAFLLTLG